MRRSIISKKEFIWMIIKLGPFWRANYENRWYTANTQGPQLRFSQNASLWRKHIKTTKLKTELGSLRESPSWAPDSTSPVTTYFNDIMCTLAWPPKQKKKQRQRCVWHREPREWFVGSERWNIMCHRHRVSTSSLQWKCHCEVKQRLADGNSYETAFTRYWITFSQRITFHVR